MKVNIGSVDRSLRIVIGVILMSFVYVGPETPLGWIGVVPLLSSVFRVCPFYLLFGVDTCNTFGVNTCTTSGQ